MSLTSQDAGAGTGGDPQTISETKGDCDSHPLSEHPKDHRHSP
ncbi:MAG: hypothetical protein ACKVHR_12380 [Pirellulales bacterium]|jgi:hypothetical protein